MLKTISSQVEIKHVQSKAYTLMHLSSTEKNLIDYIKLLFINQGGYRTYLRKGERCWKIHIYVNQPNSECLFVRVFNEISTRYNQLHFKMDKVKDRRQLFIPCKASYIHINVCT